MKALVIFARNSRSMFQPIIERRCYRPHQSGASWLHLASDSYCFPALFKLICFHLGHVLLGSMMLHWSGCFFIVMFCSFFFCSIGEKTVFGCFGLSTFVTVIKLGWNGWFGRIFLNKCFSTVFSHGWSISWQQPFNQIKRKRSFFPVKRKKTQPTQLTNQRRLIPTEQGWTRRMI